MNPQTCKATQLAIIGTPGEPQLSIAIENKILHIKCDGNMLDLIARDWLRMRTQYSEVPIDG